MIEVRLLQTDEYKEAASLSDLVFRSADQVSMGTAFPHVFSPAMRQSYGVFADEKLVSFMGLVPAIVRIGPAAVTIYSLGSVCTHPDHQGKGYAGMLMEKVLEHAEQSGAALLLVSGDRSLYRRNHCYPFGECNRYRLDRTSMPVLDKAAGETFYSRREALPTDWFHIKRLSEQRGVRFEQSLWDLADLIHAEPVASITRKHHKLLIAEKDGGAVAFAVFGVSEAGEDGGRKANLIEWAGLESAVPALLQEAMQRFQLDELKLTVPFHEYSLNQIMKEAEYTPVRNGGTVHVVNVERLLDQLYSYLREKSPEACEQLQVRTGKDGKTELMLKEGWMPVDEESMTALLFGGDSARVDDPVLNALFPIPFPFTEGLNYV